MAEAPPVWTRIITVAAAAGLAPFIAGLVFTVNPSLQPLDQVVFERALLGYGAVILGFLSGVRWGMRMQGGFGSDIIYLAAIVVSGGGFLTLLLPFPLGIALLIVGFGAQGAWDVWGGFRGSVPRAYARMRSVITWMTCAVLIATLVAAAIV